MDMAKLGSADMLVVRPYVTKKFRMFEKMKQPDRIKKCRQYYDAVRDKPANARVVTDQYFSIFRAVLDTTPVAGNALEPHRKVIEADLAKLKKWDKEQDWQEGPVFVDKLRRLMVAYDASACEDISYRANFGKEAKSAMTGKGALCSSGVEASFDAILAMQQEAKFEFTCRTDNFGTLGAKIEESLKVGAWGSGKAAAAMSAAGFSAEAQFMFAAGLELKAEGLLSWGKGNVGLELGGGVNVFAGAKAGAGFKLGVDAQRNLTASVEAGCFAGLAITCDGHCAINYAGKAVVETTAEFGLKLGVGAEFSAEYSTSIFGPMNLSIGLGGAIGLGAEIAGTLALDFSQIYTLGADAFRTAIYLPTLAKGYKMDLMSDDTRNRYYLMKSIALVEEELQALTEVMDTPGSTAYARLR